MKVIFRVSELHRVFEGRLAEVGLKTIHFDDALKAYLVYRLPI